MKPFCKEGPFVFWSNFHKYISYIGNSETPPKYLVYYAHNKNWLFMRISYLLFCELYPGFVIHYQYNFDTHTGYFFSNFKSNKCWILFWLYRQISRIECDPIYFHVIMISTDLSLSHITKLTTKLSLSRLPPYHNNYFFVLVTV